jgi:tryptophan-rich sensory protein
MNRYLSLAAFLVLTVGGGAVIGLWTGPDAWYASLVKPSFNPPNWVFAPVWTTLYVMIAVAGWRLWQRARASFAMKLWWGQLALNFVWTPVFFLGHALGPAFAIIVLLLGAILAFIAAARPVDRVAACCSCPMPSGCPSPRCSTDRCSS